ncbi:hypothetical protein [Streptomyces sp. NPDC017993]|uniref:hypothetical protein n=1 Tax=Streptomyces sp. NPDC017993 TaxID=3365027 RepID=UPI00378E8966
MTLANCPVTDEVVDQLLELSHFAAGDDTPDDEAFDAFLNSRGWRYSAFDDSYETAAGQVVWSGHYDGDPGPSGQTAWATFSVYDPEYDGVPDADHLASVWGRARGWTLRADQGRGQLDADWQAAAALLTARFGRPCAVARCPDPAGCSPRSDRHYALWRGADRLLCLAQDPDPFCYACFLRNVLVVVPADTNSPLPGPDALTDWYAHKLLGEGEGEGEGEGQG